MDAADMKPHFRLPPGPGTARSPEAGYGIGAALDGCDFLDPGPQGRWHEAPLLRDIAGERRRDHDRDGETAVPTGGQGRRAPTRRRILLLSPFFHPEPISTGRYNARLAEHLRDAGADVSVVCSHPLYPEWVVRATSDDLPGIQTHRGGGFVRYPRHSMLRRLVLETWFTLHALRTVAALRSRIDCAVAIFPPSLFWAAVVHLLPAHVRTTGIVHDLQGTYTGRLLGQPRLARWIRAAVLRVERSAFARCGRLVFLSEAMRKQAVVDYGLPPGKCVVAYPPATLDDSAVAQVPPPLADTDVQHVVYSGALGLKQDPDGLLRLLEQLARTAPHVRCHVFSRGPVFERLRASACAGLVRFHDLVEEGQLAGLYERSAVQVVSEMPGVSQGSLPSKLANILWMGVPVFCVTDAGSELAALVEDSGIGVVDSSFRPEQQLRSLAALLDRSRSWDRAASKAAVRARLGERFSFAQVLDALEPQ